MRALRLVLLKPSFGVTGGFESVVDRVEATLRADGHSVTRSTMDVNTLPALQDGMGVPPDIHAAVPEYLRYVAAVESYRATGMGRFDAVLSTQPPSFALPHPRHLGLFFHHHRIFYDLEEVYLEAGYAPRPDLHRQAAAHVRAIDQPLLDSVTWFAAGSETVRRRLGRFNGIDRISLFHAGVGAAAETGLQVTPPSRRDGAVLCVGRMEFPKRPELFVAAMRRLPGVPAVIVGAGGRADWVRAVDHRLSRPGTDLDAVDERGLWCCQPSDDDPAPDGWASNVELAGRVDDATLAHLYATAPCLVAPAYDEDYGLTAVEAMAHGTPVVVCDDGGGLADLVEHEVDGLVVPPAGAAIAAAVERIRGDADLADALSAGARARAARTTWARADDEIRLALAITMEEAEASAAPAAAP